MRLNDMKISRKLAVAFVLMIVTSIAASALVYGSLRSIEEANTLNMRARVLAGNIRDAYTALVETQAVVRAYVLTDDPRWLEDYRTYGEHFTDNITAFRDNTVSDELRQQAQGLMDQAEQWHSRLDEVVSLNQNPATRDRADALVTQIRLAELRESADAIIAGQNAMLERRFQNQQAAVNSAGLTLLIGGGVSVLIACVMAWLLTRSIASPIVQMTTTMGRLAAGDNSVDIPGAGRRDEVGQMASAVQGFKDAAIEKQRLEAETVASRAAAEQERARNEAERAAKAEQQALVVDSLASGLKSLSEGDLTVRVRTAFAEEYEQLRTDFNNAMDSLQRAMSTIVANSGGIHTGAGEISQAADDLSRRTEQQAASLEETAAALDEITATVRKTADGAKQANGVVAATRSDAEASGQVVRETVAAMAEIEKSARQISQIIGVIDEIAFQTNLLALNAGVEAARAGEAGRGFAVVASEVRALAQRSSEAAKEIKGLISTSSQHVETGVGLVGEAGKALEVIVAKVGEISGLVGEIAASAQEQATALAEVNTAINQMDQVTQQNAAMVEQSTAASHSLTQEANELMDLVRKFQTGDGASRTAQHAKPRPQPRPESVGQQRRRVQQFAANGSAAVKNDSDWQEF